MIDPGSIEMLPANELAGNTLKLDTIPEYENQIYDLNNEKSFRKYLVDLEREVRTSFEYKRFIRYLRQYCSMDRCAYFDNTTYNPDSKVSIEIHHHPFTLYDICTIVVSKRLYNGENMDLEMVAEEIMRLHYEGKVGLIPLSKTPHELYHNGFLQIPLNNVRGNWRAFRNEYWDFFTDEQKDVTERIIQYNGDYNEKEANRVLEQKNIYIQSEVDEYRLPDLHPVLDRITSRISEIKANHYQLPMADYNDYQKQIAMVEEKAKQEEERKRNLINPIIEYPDNLTDEEKKAILEGV